MVAWPALVVVPLFIFAVLGLSQATDIEPGLSVLVLLCGIMLLMYFCVHCTRGDKCLQGESAHHQSTPPEEMIVIGRHEESQEGDLLFRLTDFCNSSSTLQSEPPPYTRPATRPATRPETPPPTYESVTAGLISTISS